MHIYYDGNSPDMALYNGVMYRYVHSLQGDILGLCDGAGNLVVQYYYDAWGRQIAKYGTLESTLGTLNPLRYRGYVYDEDLGLYYLRSRYYSPWWGRFLSADAVLGDRGVLFTHNLFAYCRNKPVMHVDMQGLKDVIYTSKDECYVENDTMLHNILNGTDYYIEISGQRYKANSSETAILYEWTSVNFDFMENEFDTMVDNARPYRNLMSVYRESIGGKLDFKLQLDEDSLYYIDGTVYNRNEAGNFIWAYYLLKNGYGAAVPGVLAQGGSLVGSKRLDESWDVKARYAGISYYYKRSVANLRSRIADVLLR